MTPDQIRQWGAQAQHRNAEHEMAQIPGGTCDVITILVEIAAQLAAQNDALRSIDVALRTIEGKN